MNQTKSAIEIPEVKLDLGKQPVSASLWNRIHLWHGEKKIGKTVQANRIPGGTFFLKCEPGHDHIEHSGEVIESWPKLIGTCRAIAAAMREPGGFPFRTICVDTVGEAYLQCRSWVLARHNLDHESEADFGKGWSLVESEFRRVMVNLCRLGLGMVWIAHTTAVERRTKAGSRTELVVDLPKGGLKLIPGMAHLILYFTREFNQSTGKWERVIRTRGGDGIEAGVRYPPSWKRGLPPVLPMDYEALVAAWNAGAPDDAETGSRLPDLPTPSEPDEEEEPEQPPPERPRLPPNQVKSTTKGNARPVEQRRTGTKLER